MRLTGPIEIIGTGLLGTSVGLACRGAGFEVLLRDVDERHLASAVELGAGRRREPGDRPQLVVVCVPPDLLGQVIADALDATDDAVVTDVGSVKSAPLAAVAEHPGVERYAGGHPMAGSERSGPTAGSAALFTGRPWAITPHPTTTDHAIDMVEDLAIVCGAVPLLLDPAEHDRAVARISHVPHLMAALTAARLAGAPRSHTMLSGQGVRDVTRVAAGDPRLYGQIVAGNADAVVELLTDIRADLDRLIDAVAAGDRDGVGELLGRAVDGQRAIPAKHGGPATPMRSVYVVVPDRPGELARVFGDTGEIGVNVEDFHIDHDPGRPSGVLELVVAEESADHLVDALESRGWVTQ